METKQKENIYNRAITILSNGIKDQDKLKYALHLAKNIKSIHILLDYVDIACNPDTLNSIYYERILIQASKQEFIKPMKYIKTIFTNKKFLNSINCEQGLRMLEDNKTDDEYEIFFILMDLLDEKEKDYKEIISNKKI